ncbi:MAG: hypothetical protein WC714_27880 [Candidatus Obscuribacterales bacterium]|jgi:hypothetical protein
MKYENKKRAARALAALRGRPTPSVYGSLAADYYDHSRRSDWQQCPEDGIADLLCDLRHVCDALKLDFDSLNAHGEYNYQAERT